MCTDFIPIYELNVLYRMYIASNLLFIGLNAYRR